VPRRRLETDPSAVMRMFSAPTSSAANTRVHGSSSSTTSPASPVGASARMAPACTGRATSASARSKKGFSAENCSVSRRAPDADKENTMARHPFRPCAASECWATGALVSTGSSAAVERHGMSWFIPEPAPRQLRLRSLPTRRVLRFVPSNVSRSMSSTGRMSSRSLTNWGRASSACQPLASSGSLIASVEALVLRHLAPDAIERTVVPGRAKLRDRPRRGSPRREENVGPMRCQGEPQLSVQ
jgi:hypothetical protein